MARPPVHIPRYLLAAVLLPLSSIPLLTAAAPPAATAWSATIGESGIGAYSVGNPQAKVKLVEYFSYTCSHCAEFAKEAGVPLKAQYIDKGSVLFEYRNLIRDPVDMTAAMLARCGGAKAFAANHQAIFAAQPVWLAKAAKLTKEQQAPWYQGALGERTARIAADVGLDALMRGRGYSAAQIKACLSSGVAEAELMGMTNIGLNADRVKGTPTFFINGRRAEVGHWPELKTLLDAAIKGS
ncbi:thioredoxin domain-containing protein [Sphingopyxis indica]|uniref:Thioredoxin n=1 Tax=Sphingopyxis indica TaxID=436663 RepID=A0A239HQ33_9SPHN|nr:thioredoxin domain-containing protein [Sphingopyxis indica]WOF42949.1 DsbA family protein [Sphingopyxis indica]SNS83198.1 Thioredoxin [Sphingopyxis indica]